MKIRSDYVTNSSSSSYIIAFKGFPEVDYATSVRYPWIKTFAKLIEKIITGDDGGYAGTIIEGGEELYNYFYNRYVPKEKFDTLESYFEHDRTYYSEKSYEEQEYEECLDYINRGYKIIFKRVDYDDEIIMDILEDLKSENFVFITGGD